MKVGKGRYYLTIEKVDGNILSYAAPSAPLTQLTIDGDRMSGSMQGREGLKIELRKKTT
jgi:hypothetical protein